MKFLNLFWLLSFLLFSISCSKDESITKDEEKPTITINYSDGFPKACAELSRGQSYNFKAMVSDNEALASYSLDIHHNFDQHTHDDQGEECELYPKKSSVNPLIFLENYTIEGGTRNYEININVNIPDDIDVGDYHCSYSVTDETGWQSRTSIDIKIVE
ncbi:DUF4625 domain-containing protein [Membranihabitans marinus]|uniref:DUF4625 domain-containing protein n=1 Tax=Membranihabitans marinus TaxID=1227546 RepID=UPI001F3B218E|nr:DUF4625 domain-containing protein [Membranihabitans marinus]